MRAALRGLREAVGIALLLGCAAGSDPSPPRGGQAPFSPSGFLGDYSAFRSGGGERARLVYLDTSADFSGFERVIVEPAVVWTSDAARFAGVPSSEREALARQFQAELARAFAAEFTVSGEADAPGTLRVRSALTGAIATPEDPEQLQYIEVELELRDAATNARLAAAVDSKGAEQLAETRAAFRDWAERVAVRVAALRDLDRQRTPQ